MGFRQLAERLAVKGLVDLPDLGVFVAGAQGHGPVPPVQGFDAAFTGLVRVFRHVLGLSAAADTAARAGHDLHKVVLFSALFHVGEEAAGISGAVNDGYLERQLPDGHLGLPARPHTPGRPGGRAGIPVPPVR